MGLFGYFIIWWAPFSGDRGPRHSGFFTESFVWYSILKSMLFGFIISSVAAFGYTASGGALGWGSQHPFGRDKQHPDTGNRPCFTQLASGKNKQEMIEVRNLVKEFDGDGVKEHRCHLPRGGHIIIGKRIRQNGDACASGLTVPTSGEILRREKPHHYAQSRGASPSTRYWHVVSGCGSIRLRSVLET